ncbi:MAG TPA: ABC transporter permease [Acidimicrobiales bacterium]|jgi:peptide/nickel transport system permease protein
MVSIGEVAETVPGPLPEGGPVQGPRAGWRLALSSFVENKLAVVGVGIIVFFIAFCFLGPFVYHTNQIDTNVIDAYLPPGKGHPLGTDGNGFDELGRMMRGGQAALEIGLFASLIATVIGTLVGAVAGLIGGILDGLLMRIVDILLSIPLLFVILIVSAHFNGASVFSLSLIIGAFSWLVSARLVRGEVLTLRVRDFVLASRTMGASKSRLIYKHLIPNALGVVIVNITFQVADAINLLALLGFLGFGLNYPQVDWGDMLSDALNSLQDGYWWLVYPVGICLVLVVMAFNFIGDALRDTVDVRLRRR